jgi:hypothetical protein
MTSLLSIKNLSWNKISLGQKVMMIVWPIGLALMQFRLFWLNNFEFSIGTAVCLAVLCFTANLRFSQNQLLIAIFFLIYVLILGCYAENSVEFIKSYLQLCILVIVGIMCCSVALPHPRLVKLSINIFNGLCVIIALLVITQFIFLNVFNSYFLMNPYGSHSPIGPGYIVYSPGIFAAIKRPNGIFSEPSTAGLFLTFGASVALASPKLIGRSSWIKALICSAGAIATLSLAAFINIMALSLCLNYIKKIWKGKKLLRILFIAVVFTLIGWFIASADLKNRVNNFFIEGTSSYYRLSAPIYLLADSIPDFPLGHPLGQVDYIAGKSYMVNWKYGSQTNIDNSFFMIYYYFGVLGIVISLVVWIYAAYLFFKGSYAVLIILTLLLALGTTGALWSPNIVLLIGFGIILIRYIRCMEQLLDPESKLITICKNHLLIKFKKSSRIIPPEKPIFSFKNYEEES